MTTGEHLIMSAKERKRKVILEDVRRGLISLKDASQRMEVGYRQAKRIWRRYRQQGDAGLVHASRGRSSNHVYAENFKSSVLKIYQEQYFDFGPTFAAEKLQELNKISVNTETLRLWLLQANLWCHHRRRKIYRQRRERRERFGELLQIDGSIHAWFGREHPHCCLLNIVDDATGITMSQLDKGETCWVLLSTLKWWIEKYGVPKAVYVDLKSLYVSPRRLVDSDIEIAMHVFERVCRLLNIEIIKAYSPQAKGRVERNHGVYQDRFVKELKLRNITSIDEANAFLKNVYLDKINKKFAKQPAVDENAHCTARAYGNLDQIFCWEYTRQIRNDFTLRFNNEFIQLEKQRAVCLRANKDATIRVHLDGTTSIWYANQRLRYRKIKAPIIVPKEHKEISSCQRSELAKINKHKTPWSQFNPAWLGNKKTIETNAICP
jgi:hypothetical protein